MSRGNLMAASHLENGASFEMGLVATWLILGRFSFVTWIIVGSDVQTPGGG